MLHTPMPPKKRRPLLPTQPIDTSLLPGTPYGQSRQHSPCLGLPAKYCGIPNFMQYRIGPGAELAEAALSYADLRWSNFRGANLKGAQLSDSILWGSTLTNADLSGADLSHADFTGADLVGTDLSNTRVEGSCFLGARYSKTTRFPKGFGDPKSRGLISLDDSLQIC